MANSRRMLRLLLTLALAAACGDACAIYKCQDAQGKTTYQQKPCDAAAAQSSVGAEPRAAPSAQRATAAPPASGAPPAVATLMSAVVRCGEQSPAFTEKIQGGYARWVDANADGVQNFQRSPEYSRLLADARKQRAASGGKISPQLVEECKKTEDYFAQNWPPHK